MWCWRILSRVPWTARSNKSILKISPGCSLEGLILRLKLQYFGHLMRRVDSLYKTLMLARIGGRRGWQMMRWLDGITDSMDVGLGRFRELDGQGGLACCDSLGCKESDTTKRLNWTELCHLAINNIYIVKMSALNTDLTRNWYKYMRRIARGECMWMEGVQS